MFGVENWVVQDGLIYALDVSGLIFNIHEFVYTKRQILASIDIFALLIIESRRLTLAAQEEFWREP